MFDDYVPSLVHTVLVERTSQMTVALAPGRRIIEPVEEAFCLDGHEVGRRKGVDYETRQYKEDYSNHPPGRFLVAHRWVGFRAVVARAGPEEQWR